MDSVAPESPAKIVFSELRVNKAIVQQEQSQKVFCQRCSLVEGYALRDLQILGTEL